MHMHICRIQLPEDDFGKQLSRLVLSSSTNMPGFKESITLSKVSGVGINGAQMIFAGM